MAETAVEPSTIPIITISSDAQEDGYNSSSSSGLSDAQTAPSPIDKSPPTLQRPLDTTDEVIIREPLPDKQKRHAAPLSKPNSSSGSKPPRTLSGPASSMKRNKEAKGTKNSSHMLVDDKTSWHGMVLDYGHMKQEVSKVVAFPSKMVYAPPNIPYNDSKSWTFQKSLGYSDFIGSGFVFIQVNGEKERKNVKDNTYVFIVLEGAVEATIHHTSYAISTGGVFLVPRGNDYSIRNISDKDAKLFFTQARNETEAPVRLNRPSTKSLVLADWLLQRFVARLIKLRAQAFAWYWQHLVKYRHLFFGRRLYFICFLLGLMVRRLPFIGSPPILNIQLVPVR